MKIALIVEHFDASRGSAEHLAAWLANQLALRSHEVHVICHDVSTRLNRYRQATQRASHDAELSSRAHVADDLPHDGLHVHRLMGMRLNTGIGFRRFGVRAREWCRRNRPDVVHSFSVAYAGDVYQACGGVYAAMRQQAAAGRSTQSGATLKQMLLRLSSKQRTLLALERRVMRDEKAIFRRVHPPRKIISLCPMMTQQLREHFDIDPRRIVELITPRLTAVAQAASQNAEARALEREWFRAHYGLHSTDRVALFVGHDFRRKGLRFAIEAIALARDWKLLVVGLGKARAYVEQADALGIGDAVRSNGHAPRVLFVGPTREMDMMYRATDALLLPTFYDPFGLVALEALGHGMPVISTPFLGPARLVEENEAGVIVSSPRATLDMAKALEALPPAASKAGTQMRGRALHAAEGPSAERYVERVLALYGQVAKA